MRGGTGGVGVGVGVPALPPSREQGGEMNNVANEPKKPQQRLRGLGQERARWGSAP